jgi:hypothetical protein
LEKVKSIPGWLHDVAGQATLAVLDHQAGARRRGPVVEIGVFGGRYLALLADRANAVSDSTVGIDIYIYIDEQTVLNNIRSVGVSTEAVRLIKADSAGLDGPGFERISGGKPRFISVDGDHAARAVHHDLVLVRDAMARDGICAIDDFLNPLAFGVNEGVNRFFLDGAAGELRPVCYTGGKLFVAFPEYVEEYRSVLETFAKTDEALPETRRYRELAAQNRAYVIQPLFGHEVLVIGER